MYEDFLRKIPLFAELPAEDLARLCQMVEEVRLTTGEILFHEGSVADKAYVLYEGELEVFRLVDGRKVFIDTQNKPGTVIGEMALLEETTRLASLRAQRDSLLLSLDHNQIQELLVLSPTAAKIMLHTLSRRWRALEAQVQHNERMAQLGTLTAGMAHELNNPAAAVVRGSGQLQALIGRAEEARAALDRLQLTDEQQAYVIKLAKQIQTTAVAPLILDPLSRSDREEGIENWLDDQAIANGWELAPTLANLGLEPPHLTDLAALFTTTQLPILLSWAEVSYSAQSLIHEITQGAGRIAEIVKALKSYVYLDQAPLQNIDIHAGLNNTLIILRSKLKPNITIKQEYDPHLPGIMAYGSELNQVWTNMIDNAIDALADGGEITIRTRQEGAQVVVEIEDNGPGISDTQRTKIFDPFFTTKSPGQGTGLGMTISYNIVARHNGEINVSSEPGRTIFQVRLPLRDE